MKSVEKIPFKTWAYGGILLLSLGTLPVDYVAYRSFKEINEARVEVVDKYGRGITLSEGLRYWKSLSQTKALLYLLTRNQIFLDELREDNERVLSIIRTLHALNLGPDSRQLLEQIRLSLTELTQKSKESWSRSDVEEYRRTSIRPLNDKIEALINRHFDLVWEKLKVVRLEADELSESLSRTLSLTFSLTMGGYFLIFLLLRKVIRLKQEIDLGREKELRKTEELASARKEILETVSHDLKNPLSSLTIAARILEREVRENPRAEKSIASIQKATDNMRGLVEDLLDAVKSESGNLVLNLAAEDPEILVEDALESISEIAKSRQIKLQVRKEPGETKRKVLCDRKRVSQIFSNLLGNALKFTPAGGEIQVGVREEERVFSFTVKDTGPGIDPAQLPHLFDRYWQADKDRRAGTGLGLSIAKRLIDEHGGRIEVESQIGVGTLFRFELPAV